MSETAHEFTFSLSLLQLLYVTESYLLHNIGVVVTLRLNPVYHTETPLSYFTLHHVVILTSGWVELGLTSVRIIPILVLV